MHAADEKLWTQRFHAKGAGENFISFAHFVSNYDELCCSISPGKCANEGLIRIQVEHVSASPDLLHMMMETGGVCEAV